MSISDKLLESVSDVTSIRHQVLTFKFNMHAWKRSGISITLSVWIGNVCLDTGYHSYNFPRR